MAERLRSPKASVSIPALDPSLPPTPIILSDPPRDLPSISAQDGALVFPAFTTETAWTIGNLLRSRLMLFPTATVINIALANSSQVLFHTVTHGGVVPDNDLWVARKRATVLRWGQSSWYMSNKFAGDESAFASKYMLGQSAGQYAIHGGGWPVRVKGVEGVVAVIVVSGLKQHEDHQIIVQTVGDYLEGVGASVEGELEKRKED